MKLAEYTAGSWKQQFQYRSFVPTEVNRLWQWDDPQLNTLLAEANRRLGELNGLSLIVPNLDRFITMHVVKEAQTSSRIEGTRTEMDEAILEDRKAIAPEKRDDWQEVRNYVAAMNRSVAQLAELPLSNRLLCDAHGILLSGARGETKTPGEFRRSQNWIGGATLADAAFVPPHHDELPRLLSDLENFWHNEEIDVPQLIRIAISHYQFETIHPFQDGNGRIGRLLITLYLVDKQLLQYPCLYLSSHFEKHRAAYYDALMRVRTSNDLNHWLRFFLVAVIETAKASTQTLRDLFALQQSTTQIVQSLGRSAPNAARAINILYERPILTSSDLREALGVSKATGDRLIKIFMEHEILTELTGQKRNRYFIFEKYFRLFAEEHAPS